MIDEIKQIRESQIRMEADLKYHIKRTDLLEIDVARKHQILSEEIEQIDTDVRALSKPMSFVDVMKIAGIISACVASVLAILQHFKV